MIASPWAELVHTTMVARQPSSMGVQGGSWASYGIINSPPQAPCATINLPCVHAHRFYWVGYGVGSHAVVSRGGTPGQANCCLGGKALVCEDGSWRKGDLPSKGRGPAAESLCLRACSVVSALGGLSVNAHGCSQVGAHRRA